jgi:hypothetical protein
MARFVWLIISLVVVLYPGLQGPIEASQNPNPFDSLNLRGLQGNAGLLELRKLHFWLQQPAEQDRAGDQEVAGDTAAEIELETTEKQDVVEHTPHSRDIPRLDQIFNRFIMSRLPPTISQVGSKD